MKRHATKEYRGNVLTRERERDPSHPTHGLSNGFITKHMYRVHCVCVCVCVFAAAIFERLLQTEKRRAKAEKHHFDDRGEVYVV